MRAAIRNLILFASSGVVIPANTVAPSITSAAVVGTQITGDDGTWTGTPSLTYKWQRNNGGFADIGGATSKNYTPVSADFGYTLRLVVTDSVSGTSANSNATNATIVTSFTQSLGAELAANGVAPITFSGDNPTSWTVVGEVGADPEVTERAANAGHADPVGVGGAINFFSSATAAAPIIRQTILTSGGIFRALINVSKRVTGTALQFGSQSGNFTTSLSTAIQKMAMGRAASTTAQVFSGGVGGNFTVDAISFKRYTLNTARVSTPNATHDYTFTPPASPIAGQECHLQYRISAPGDEFNNCWDAYLRRNDANTAWDARLDSISAGTRTNRVNVTGVGTPNGLRVTANGDNHDFYTVVSGTPTQRGSTITNATFNTATGVNTIADPGFTEVSLASTFLP